MTLLFFAEYHNDELSATETFRITIAFLDDVDTVSVDSLHVMQHPLR